MKKIIVSVAAVMMLVGCGGESTPSALGEEKVSDTSTVQTTATTTLARDNMLKEVVKSFRSYQVKVVTDKTLADDAVSKDTFAVYGEIDGENTAALLKLNSNYPAGTKITVKVYDSESNKLVGESVPLTYNGGVVYFGSVDVK